jgi:Domain of unknown function (DUF6265)
MKNGTGLFCILISFLVLCAWTTKQMSDIKKAEWLIGTWENKTARGSIYETWNKEGDNEFSGMSYIIKENDTVVFENIRLVQEQNALVYIPAVKSQNDAMPVRFASKTISETQMVFENPEHDFPQVISYTKIGSDSLVAEISGTKNGQERKRTFPMKRVR